MIIRLLYLLLICICLPKLYAQNQSQQDLLGVNYKIENQEIIKNDGFNQFKYKNVLLGKIEHLDVVNPLQTLVFYKQQNNLVLLDRNLTEISTINLNQTYPNIQAVYAGLSIKNNIWIVDIISKRVGLLSISDKNLRFITNNLDTNITWIASNLNNLYFLNTINQLHEIDVYGKINFITQLPQNIKLYYNLNQFEVIDTESNKTINRFEIHKGKLKNSN